MRRLFVFLFAAILLPATTEAAGYARSTNFNVLASDQALAESVLARAELFRQQLARQVLKRELPSGVGPTMITVLESPAENTGFTWPIDDLRRKFHKVWLRTSREAAVGNTLRRQILYVVLATHASTIVRGQRDEPR